MQALSLQGMLEDAERSAESWQDRHREAMSEMRVLTDKARQAATLADEYEHDLGNARQELQEEQRLVSSLRVCAATQLRLVL